MSFLPGTESDITEVVNTSLNVFEYQSLLENVVLDDDYSVRLLVNLFCKKIISQTYNCKINLKPCSVTNIVFVSQTNEEYLLHREERYESHIRKFFNRLVPLIERQDHFDLFNKTYSYSYIESCEVVNWMYDELSVDGLLNGISREITYDMVGNYSVRVSSIIERRYKSNQLKAELEYGYLYSLERAKLTYSVYRSDQIYATAKYKQSDFETAGVDFCTDADVSRLLTIPKRLYKTIPFSLLWICKNNISSYQLTTTPERKESHHIWFSSELNTKITDEKTINLIYDNRYAIGLHREYEVAGWYIDVYATIIEQNPNRNFSTFGEVDYLDISSIRIRNRRWGEPIIKYDSRKPESLGLKPFFDNDCPTLLAALHEIGTDSLHIDEVAIATIIMKYSDRTPGEIKSFRG